MINNDADDSIVYVCVWCFLCLLAQLLLRSQLCNLIMYDKISIIVFTIPIFWMLYLHCALIHAHPVLWRYAWLRWCLARAGRPTKLCQWFRVRVWLPWGLGPGISNHILSNEQIHTVRCEKISSACPWSLGIKFSFSRNNKGWYFSLHYRRAATRLTFKDSMTNSKRKRGI